MEITSTAGWVPIVACTLASAEQPLRVAALDDLIGTSMRTVERRWTTHATLTFAGDGTFAERVRQLADAETACCSFLTFTVTTRAGETVLDIEVPEQYADVLAGLVDGAARAASCVACAAGRSPERPA